MPSLVRPKHVLRWSLTFLFGLAVLAFLVRHWPAASRPSLRYWMKLFPVKSGLHLPGLHQDSYDIDNAAVPAFPAFKVASDVLEPHIHEPYPLYTSRSYRRRWKGRYQQCVGPREVEVDQSDLDKLRYYKPLPSDPQPHPMFGSQVALAIDPGICFDRWSRFNPAGYDEDHLDLTRDLDVDVLPRLNWDDMDWDRMQEECYTRNKDRYEEAQSASKEHRFPLPTDFDFANPDSTLHFSSQSGSTSTFGQQSHPRLGVVVHLEAKEDWTTDTKQFLRSLITELSLHTGAEYEIILLVRSSSNDPVLFSDRARYHLELDHSTPPEFRNISLLYNAALLAAWYPRTTLTNPNDQHSQSQVQTLALLSLLRPDLNGLYRISVDARYAGHTYPLLESLTSFATSQARAGMWERNAHLYLPAIHHSYAKFSSLFASNKPTSPPSGPGIKPIIPDAPDLKVANSQTQYRNWGTSEPADLITLSPILSPAALLFPVNRTTDHRYLDPTLHPLQNTTILNFPLTHLKTTTSDAITFYSKRLLRAIHHTQITTHAAMPGPMLGPSIAYVHGLKAVVAPMPNWLDVAATAERVYGEFEEIVGGSLNTEAARGLATEKSKSQGRQITDAEKFVRLRAESPSLSLGMTSPVRGASEFGDELYKRWMGYGKDPDEKLCLPPMLLYPVRGV